MHFITSRVMWTPSPIGSILYLNVSAYNQLLMNIVSIAIYRWSWQLQRTWKVWNPKWRKCRIFLVGVVLLSQHLHLQIAIWTLCHGFFALKVVSLRYLSWSSLKVFGLKRGGLRVSLNFSKLGSDTRCSNELLIDNFPQRGKLGLSLRDFAHNFIVTYSW